MVPDVNKNIPGFTNTSAFLRFSGQIEQKLAVVPCPKRNKMLFIINACQEQSLYVIFPTASLMFRGYNYDDDQPNCACHFSVLTFHIGQR
jgi:hypothetical protein